eukprot:NODE_17959_length_918_cov_4.322377.p4 GENE.NODE_17959_length_918_cov_4.322377~~NODE_17959_length_918_cov_4.322377.p4  ORF type:complete len:57 (-),score=43.06 NODE_17959_length_918_cov_4.322377:98-268(-)
MPPDARSGGLCTVFFHRWQIVEFSNVREKKKKKKKKNTAIKKNTKKKKKKHKKKKK